ncbi:MAG: hypothetical protein K2X99_04245 [Gemmatimonadaceae bacterium]|nr:hypothetical protein [Gemmatimonadaceae bacterium]
MIGAVVVGGGDTPLAFHAARMDGQEFVLTMMLMGLTFSVAFPLVRAFAQRLEGKPKSTLPDPELAQRLERLERGMEAIAVEMERVGEGQRFVTKLLAERDRTLSSGESRDA